MTDKPLIDISPENWNIVRSILQRYIPERAVWAFGSRVKWTAKEYSDLDIAIIGDEPLSLGSMADLELAFQDSALPFKVDVVDWATITPAFRNVIEARKVLIQDPRTVEGWAPKLVSDIADLNPSRTLKKGEESPFIEMAALAVNGRDIPPQDVARRAFSGSGSRFKDGDVLLARITPCLENGKTALVNVLGSNVVGHGSTEFIVLSAKEQSDQRFIYYLARHPDFRDYAIQHMEGTSGRQRVSATAIGTYRFLCPPPPHREEIGETLGALDDQISLLRETNATLEALAQALFKSWFVDFDPVRAKAEGREPEGVPPEMAELFPSEFEDSELGEVPKGWQMLRVGDVLELAYGKALKATDRIEGDVPVYGSGGITGFHNQALVDGPSVIVGRKGTVGSLYWEDRKFFPIDTVFFVRPLKAPLSYCYYMLQTLGLDNMNTDAAVPGLNRENVYRLKVSLPSGGLLELFDEYVSLLRKKIFLASEESRGLSATRDSLLPRLMSGQLHIADNQHR
jgi:type I restriction enzyme S subunit